MSVRSFLSGPDFVQMVYAGHQRLKAQVAVVNALNIFPVPDGDTGTNMELSLASGVAELRKLKDGASLADVCHALDNGLLMGARGNSGVILSQLFRGFARTVQHHDVMDVALFAKSLQEGVSVAYRAVAKPVEGTILTVAKEAASTGWKEAKKFTVIGDWIQQVCAAAERALARTPEQLLVLKQAGVVDSGGQGLVFILDGFRRWLQGETESFSDAEVHTAGEPTALDFAAAHISHEGEFGYCTEVLFRLERPDQSQSVQNQLRQTLSGYGDSLLVVGTDEFVKVHVHTLNPGRVLEDAIQYGPLVKIKVDNMTEQHATIQTSAQVSEQVVETASQDVTAPKPMAVVAVAVGTGIIEVFESLGVDVVLSGGQTLNPSTEDIVDAIRRANGQSVFLLPNNKNIVLAAEQARQVLGEKVIVVPTSTIPEGISAMMAFKQDASVNENVDRMMTAVSSVTSGAVVRAVRDSVYQDRPIRENQVLGLENQSLVYVGESRVEAVLAVLGQMQVEQAELMTVFYGADVDEKERLTLVERVELEFGLEVELRFGGQPIYDYIFSVE